MKHLKNHPITENFTPRQFVIYNGDRARVLSRNGDKYNIFVMSEREEVENVDASELMPLPTCLGRCDKKVVKVPKEHGGGRGIYCFGCNRPIRRL